MWILSLKIQMKLWLLIPLIDSHTYIKKIDLIFNILKNIKKLNNKKSKNNYASILSYSRPGPYDATHG